MFLSVATTHRPATDLGFLLHKHPDRLHETELNFGKAWLFYPEATEERCEAALILDVEGPTVGLYKTWNRVREIAKLPGVRLHDLRHSFASFAAADGASLYLIGKALGHRQASTTERYAHLSDEPIRAVAEQVGQRFLQITAGNRATDPDRLKG